jgi:hypothetical protein
LFSEEGNEDYKISDALKELSDPFEFQDWCIQNGYEKYL